MTDDTSTLTVGPTLERSTVRRIVSIVLALVGLLVVLALAALLPGADRLVAALAVPPVALFTALATLLVVAALIWVAPAVEVAVEQALDGPPRAVRNAAVSAKLLVGFGAVVLAYRGFAAAVTPLFEAFGLGGVYHLAFTVLGVLVLGAFARRLYRCWEPVTGIVTEYATSAVGPDGRDGVSTD